MISKETIKNRIARGMTPEQAETLPLQWKRKLTKEKVLEIEAHGLSITSSAFCLMLQRKHYTHLSNVIKSSGAAKDLTTKKAK